MTKVEKIGWLAISAAGIALLAACAHIVVALSGLDSGQNQAIAAWVQAAGSIGAIMGAFAIAQSQAERLRVEAEARRSADDKAALLSVAALVDEIERAAAHAFDRFSDAVAKGESNRISVELWRNIVERVMRQLTIVPFHQAPYSHVARHAMLTMTAAEYFLDAGDQLAAAEQSDVAKRLNSVKNWIENLKVSASKVRDRAGYTRVVDGAGRTEG